MNQCLQSNNPAECEAWVNAGGNIQDYLVGGMVGAGAAYMMTNRGGRQVIVQNPNYRGPYRSLRSPIMSQDQQIRRLEKKIERQKVELRRQQEANARKKAEIKSLKSGSSSWSSSSSRSSSSWSSRSSSRRRK